MRQQVAPKTHRPPPVPPPASIAATTDVTGQWDVVSFEGYRPRRLSGTGARRLRRFREGRRRLEDRVQLHWPIGSRHRRGALLRSRLATAFRRRSGADRSVARGRCATSASSTGTRVSSSSVSIACACARGQDELILERPSVRRLSYLASMAELQGSWKMLEVSWFPPGGGAAGIGLSEVPTRIVIEGNRLRVRDCPEVDLTFQYTGEGQLRKKRWGRRSRPGVSTVRGLSDTADGPALPKASDAIRLLHANPLVEKAGDGALLLSNGEYALLISRLSA